MNANKHMHPFVLRTCKLVKGRGFALVITLALMVLLTLLVVGLLSLSTVALRTAGQGSAMAIARSNARVALIIALGELQKAAGPDQRVTAPADFAGDTGGLRLAAGKPPRNDKSINSIANGLSSLKPGTRYWLGVWNTVTASSPATQIYTKTPSATGVQWLISGNELDRTPPQTFTPSSPVAALSANGSVNDKTTAVVLVGTTSVGAPTPASIDNYVSAPMVGIAIPNPRGGQTLGRYAWWIGDEGVKARFNRVAQATPKEAVTYQNLASQRAGWEVVPPLSAYPTPADSTRHALLERVVTLPEAKLLDASLASSACTPVALFHTATTDSFGVLADSLQGGLRLDLTAYLQKGFPTSITTTKSPFTNAPKAGGNIIPKITDNDQKISSALKGPKWDVLRAFYNQAKTTTSSGKLTVKAASSVNNTDITIAPVIADLRLLMGVKMVMIDASNYRLNPCGKIAISLANPYSNTLEWKSNINLQLVDETSTQTGYSSRIWDCGGPCRFLGRTGEPGVFNNVTFSIPKGQLAPGEARAYTMSTPVNRPDNDLSQVTVTLAPFASSSPADFNNCIMLGEPASNSGGKSLDVRESWDASQPTAELRLAGGSALLRRIERFELDNAFYASVRRGVDSNTATTMPQPFPLHLYSFQLSQPGADYASLLPTPDLLGTRNSTLRTFTDFNLQAVHYTKFITSYNPPPYFMESSDSLATLPFNPPGGETGNGFTRNLAVTPMAWGRAPVGNTKKAILFTFPKTFVSLAQLQHLDLTGDDTYTNISQQPGNAVGNSYATPFVKRKYVIQSRNNYVVTGGNNPLAEKTTTNYYDISYLLNAALWDTFYFSTVAETSSASPEPLNPSIAIVTPPANSDSLSDPVEAATYLMINGAFNVNSPNKDAWKALLAGNRFLKHPADTGSTSTTDALFPRSLEQTSPGTSTPSGTADDSYTGYRRLTTPQIDALAEELVKQVRLRGPFVSLSHFINRALIDIGSSNAAAPALSRCGAIQSAIDLSGANISPDGKKSALSKIVVNDDKLKIQMDGNTPKADMWGGRGNPDYLDTENGLPVWGTQSKDLNPGSMASIWADRTMLTDSKLIPEQGYRSTGIPGWITQADVLQVIGPSIAVRSDTFRIRAYGETLSADGKTVLAKAWCEAVVQRLPLYVDPANAATQRATDLTALNKLFGRKFQIVSFRWLSANEI